MSLQYVKDEEPTQGGSVMVAAPQTPVYTYILMGCIGVVFLAQLVFGDGIARVLISGGSEPAYIAGFYKPYFIRFQEYWRILTGATVHGGLLHLLLNGYALYNLGKLVEILSSRTHLAIVFVLSCLGGGLLSLVFRPDGLSVGASGGIVGLLGYLAVYSFRRRQFISAAFRKDLLINIAYLAVFGLVLANIIDNFGHLGGLITGAVYGIFQIPSDEHIDPRQVSPWAKYCGFFALGIYIDAALLSVFLITTFHLLYFR